MFDIHIVGAGALGSTFAIELARRSIALAVPLKVTIYDFDVVEQRNLVSQDFSPSSLDVPKAEALSSSIEKYGTIEAIPIVGKVSVETLSKMEVDSNSIIVDAVDNIETRHLLWKFGAASNAAVLHLGMTKEGSGEASWSFGKVDTFSLSPKNPHSHKAKDPEQMPPCELNTYRSLIFNTAIAGVNALFLFLGFDPCKFFGDTFESNPPFGLMTTWHSDLRTFNHVSDLIGANI